MVPLPHSASRQSPNLRTTQGGISPAGPVASNAAAWRAAHPPPDLDLNDDKAAGRKVLVSVLYLGSCFAMIFWAFNVAQSLLTTLHPNVGFVTLAVLYM